MCRPALHQARAGTQVGTLTIRPFLLEGSGLRLNLDASLGECRVEILDHGKQPISGFELVDTEPKRDVDDTELELTWSRQRSLGEIQGQTIRLLLHLRQALLYSFRVTR